MNKAILILAILAFCLAPTALSSDLKGSENKDRELAGISLGNLKDIIGGLIGTIKNQTSSANNTSSTPAPNNTTTAPIVNNTAPVTNNTAPVTNNTTTTPVVNNTAPATNNTSNSNNTSTVPIVNTTQPVVDSDDSDAEDSDSSSPTNTTTPTTPATPVKYARNDVNMTAFPEDCLRVHNQERKAVGLGNLTWSDSLAKSSQVWAENMAKNGFRHSGKTGENIASSTYSTYTLGRLLGLWVKEKNHYIIGCKYPKCSTTSAEVGHYTQMVWHSTTQVGCGFAPGYNRGYNYICCQYYKAGNIVGQYVYPVPTA